MPLVAALLARSLITTVQRCSRPLPRSLATLQRATGPTFHEYVTYWLTAKIDGVIGETGGISQNTIHDYRTRLSVHLLPFFARYRLDEIDAQLCLDFKAFKLAEARDLREASPPAPTCETAATADSNPSRSPPCSAR
ncbi:hypothetical protein VSS74_05695 [Conexibacter stalactiti]|uniref:Core-binding (CB) domain-containing protein n=1 Tax=Conexibacter stalactiti TaxID=1940611 RepID=A0ABU4HKJ1_9ACTN|nr:hypothetical protein [Conexibacter stalactiti]MDW5593816.1 hypothetical protein [Conexibacter stalactiti]MEC5034458.1 hypothetical protein [Conexibacter stalactiti]